MPETPERNFAERNTTECGSVHDIIIRSREHVNIGGVKNVLSFDETSCCLETLDGELVIEGEGIRIGTLDTEKGRVALDGRITALYYNTESAPQRTGLFGRVFG